MTEKSLTRPSHTRRAEFETRHVQHSPEFYPLETIPPEANFAPPRTGQPNHLCLGRDEKCAYYRSLKAYVWVGEQNSVSLNLHTFHKFLIIFPVTLCG